MLDKYALPVNGQRNILAQKFYIVKWGKERNFNRQECKAGIYLLSVASGMGLNGESAD